MLSFHAQESDDRRTTRDQLVLARLPFATASNHSAFLGMTAPTLRLQSRLTLPALLELPPTLRGRLDGRTMYW
jgi:hypothetical protein